MLIPSYIGTGRMQHTSLSRRVNANSQLGDIMQSALDKLIKKGEC